MSNKLVGRSFARVEGREKVTGAAKYSADVAVPGLLHGVITGSRIARGRVTSIDTTAALAVPGVVAVYTHLNMPRLVVPPPPYPKGFLPLQDDVIRHNDQPVAYVVAETLEQAREAAELIDVRYAAEKAKVVIADAEDEIFLAPPGPENPDKVVIGDPVGALATAYKKVEGHYSSPTHTHNPIEPSATVAVWDGDNLTLHDTTQSISLVQQVVGQALSVPKDKIRVLMKFLGGGFGAKAPVWAHTIFTAAVSRELRRPVKIVLTRAQMFTSSGHRAEYRQQVALGADREGKLVAVRNISTQQMSRNDKRTFNTSESSYMLYGFPHIEVRHQGVQLDVQMAHFMRSPEGPALVGLETALDELSYELGIDPVELRLRNITDYDPVTRTKIGNDNLPDCLRQGAKQFGWSRRKPKPGVTKDGREYVGYGMSVEAHTYHARPSSASVTVTPDGKVVARSGTQDIGTGTYTVMSQLAGEALGVPMSAVTFELGDTNLPAAGFSAASVTVSSVSGSLTIAAKSARDAVVALAVADTRSPLHGLAPDQVEIENGFLFAKGNRSRRDSYQGVVGRHGRPVEGTGSYLNVPGYTTGAIFVEVRVDPVVGRVRVTRAVGAYDLGTVVNRRTAESQVLGGLTWGIGYALTEHTVMDRNSARVVNANLSTYMIPVNPDVPKVQAVFIDKPDATSPVGVKGFGETPVTGVPAAIGNAVYHAIGRRVRDFPITQDKLL
ncbi:xanthine dehydrogenase family protein molybdopterin-binding subunit [Actinosynnema sp. NPDC020468]|uniref:xanthine dehydrogenase family protein molybdopterin-binding subunit n=1 Tax=Actinosynnema sp. NPDC020468 TaxID=3154488 RepID=UPI0033C4BC08